MWRCEEAACLDGGTSLASQRWGLTHQGEASKQACRKKNTEQPAGLAAKYAGFVRGKVFSPPARAAASGSACHTPTWVLPATCPGRRPGTSETPSLPATHWKGMRTGSEPPLEAACGDEVADLVPTGTAVAALACRRLPWLLDRSMPAPLPPLMPSFSLGSWGSWGAERSRRRAARRCGGVVGHVSQRVRASTGTQGKQASTTRLPPSGSPNIHPEHTCCQGRLQRRCLLGSPGAGGGGGVSALPARPQHAGGAVLGGLEANLAPDRLGA